MREKLGSFANLQAAEINPNRPMEKKTVSHELCCLLSLNQLLSVSAVNLSLCLICAACVICLLPAVSLCQPCHSCLCQSVSYACLHVVSCLTCLCELSPVSHDLVSCLTNSAMNLLVSYVLKIVSYLTWTALG